ncbi:MAG: hypothetical protein HZB62_00805 [Nitrospirae bacterium]|nr:hypothetical protein [Nitrospirota bacterium]
MKKVLVLIVGVIFVLGLGASAFAVVGAGPKEVQPFDFTDLQGPMPAVENPLLPRIVKTVVTTPNPTCRWVFKNGQWYYICS